MTRLNRKAEYALIALKYLSGKYSGQLTTVKEICDSLKIPFDATSRVMQQMAQKKILKAELGAHGGYLLARDLGKLSLLEIMEVASGPVEIVRCASGKGDCEFHSKCNMATPLQNLNARLADFYRKLSVAEIIDAGDVVGHAKAAVTR